MKSSISEIQKEMKTKLGELRLKRKGVISKFKKRLEEEKIKQIKESLLKN